MTTNKKIFLRESKILTKIETFKNLRARARFSGWSQSAFSDRYFWLFFAVWFASLFISALYAFLNFSRLPLEIPLFYSRTWGQMQLAKSTYIFLPTGGCLLLGIFDMGLAVNFHSRDRIFAYLFLGTELLIAVLTLVTTINIVNIMR